MKRIIAAIIISVMVLSFCSCGSKTEKPTESETSKVIEISSTEEPEAEFGIYQEIIDEYKKAMQEGYPDEMMEDYPEKGYLSFADRMNKPEKVYYALIDLSDDGQPELFIAIDNYDDETVSKEIYDAWGCEDGMPKRLYHNGLGWKHSMIIHSDNTLLVDTRYAMGGSLELYTVKKNSARLTGEGIWLEYSFNEEIQDLELSRYFFKASGWVVDHDREERQLISEDRYYEIEADMTGRDLMPVDWIPLQ